jgi:hypothetical protein
VMSRPDWSSTSPEQRGRVALRGVDPHVTKGCVDLYWLPLGAGGRCVRLNGRMYEGIVARMAGREPLALYHSALEVHVPAGRFVIEMAPVWNRRDPQRGVVGEGSVGLRGLGRFELFRYEVRCWRDGHIPDVDEAVESPQHLSHDPIRAQRVLELLPAFPRRTWGADEQHTGDMWNSNSLVSWLLARSGHDVTTVTPPPGGRAPGWSAGLAVAAREDQAHAAHP